MEKDFIYGVEYLIERKKEMDLWPLLKINCSVMKFLIASFVQIESELLSVQF